jgi:hypothetical protein
MPYGADAGNPRKPVVSGKEGGGGRGASHPRAASWAYTPFRENLKSSVNLYLRGAVQGIATGGQGIGKVTHPLKVCLGCAKG